MLYSKILVLLVLSLPVAYATTYNTGICACNTNSWNKNCWGTCTAAPDTWCQTYCTSQTTWKSENVWNGGSDFGWGNNGFYAGCTQGYCSTNDADCTCHGDCSGLTSSWCSSKCTTTSSNENAVGGCASGSSDPAPAPTPSSAPAPTPSSAPTPTPAYGGAGGDGAPCFSAETAKACKLHEPTATAAAAFDACYKTKADGAAEAVLMATLAAGDKVLTSTTDGSLAVTHVIVNQHAATDDRSKMLTLTTADGAALSLTPDHGIFIDGVLVAAADAKKGSALTRADGSIGIVKSIAEAEAARVIMPVTATGTILASDHGAPVLAATHLMMFAPLYKYAASRTFVNAALYIVGDATNWTTFSATLLTKLAAPLAAAALVAKALKRGPAAK